MMTFAMPNARSIVQQPLRAETTADVAPVSVPTAASPLDDWSKLSIDYRYVRDYPHRAANWLAAVRAATDIPADLIPIIAAPLAGILTRLLPVTCDRLDPTGVTADGLLQWASLFPGYHNDDHSDDGYRSILTYLDTASERAASESARRTLTTTHPWRVPLAPA